MKPAFKILLFSAMLSSLTACETFTDISSSTSTTVDTVTPDVTLNNFIDKRYDAIRKDAALGGGENIEALAQLMGARDSEAFAQWMQANFDQLFGNSDQPNSLLARIEQYGRPGKG